MTDTLKPCPFCGCTSPSVSSETLFGGLQTSSISCTGTGCEASVMAFGSEEKATARWNRRTVVGPVTVQVEIDPIAAVDAAMVEMLNIDPPLERKECQRLISAALRATAYNAGNRNDMIVRDALVIRLKPGEYLRHWKQLLSNGTKNQFNITEDLHDATPFASTHDVNMMWAEIRARFPGYPEPEFVRVQVQTIVKVKP